MLNFVSLAECINQPASGCLTSPPFLSLVAAFIGLAVLGVLTAVSAPVLYRRLLKAGLLISLGIIGISTIAIAYFFVFDPNPVLGVETNSIADAVWLAAIIGFGVGVLLLAGQIGFSFGGLVAKIFGAKSLKPRRVIAVDGPAASGKGTLARRLAERFGMAYLDTGLLYRAVAHGLIMSGRDVDDEVAAEHVARSLDAGVLEDPALRSGEIGTAASIVARMPSVRQALLDYQRAIAARPEGAVLDGRDIGTVVCPDAPVKIFVTASSEERARRRHLELGKRGDPISYDAVLKDIRDRDERDIGRSVSPLVAAADAMTLDTTALDAEQAFAAALEICVTKTSAFTPPLIPVGE